MQALNPDLIAAIYDGAFEQPLWRTFLDRLLVMLKAEYVSIVFWPPGRQLSKAIEIGSGAARPDLKEFYTRNFANRDPIPYPELREGRVYSAEELLDERIPRHREFLEDMLASNGIRCLRILHVTEPGGVTAWLCVARKGPKFSARVETILDTLVPHLRRSLRAFAAIERQQTHASIATDALKRLNSGWLGLDERGHVLTYGTNMRSLLADCKILLIAGDGRLRAGNRVANRSLQEAIKQFAVSAAPPSAALNLSRDPWVDLLLVAHRSQHDSPVPRPAIIAYVQSDTRTLGDRHEQIASLFGLAGSEARLALALSRGMSITEAAEHLGVTVATARDYAKKTYAKMGARGQSDVVRMVLTSVLAFT
jgi:DNA-binding CsgD family transcriptional regulator